MKNLKKIFSGTVYDVFPLSDGILFSYCKEIIEENTVVSYKMLSFENGRFTDVAKNIYMLTKFGSNYKAIAALCGNYITARSILLPGGKVFLLEDNGTARLVDNTAAPIWTGELIYRGGVAGDIALIKNALWASFPECNALVRYNPSTMREELRIGGNKSPFNAPLGIFAEDGGIMISNSGSQELIKVDLNSYAVFNYETFEEPVKQYVKVGDYRFALLESGLYLI